MSKYEQRFRGYADNCQFCSRRFKAETLVGIKAMVDEHELVCGPETRAREERERNAKAAAVAQPDLFGDRK